MLDASAAVEGLCGDRTDPLCDRLVHGLAVNASERLGSDPAGAAQGDAAGYAIGEAIGEAQAKEPSIPFGAEPLATLPMTAVPSIDALAEPDGWGSLCVQPSAWIDPDIDRNKELIDRAGICVETLQFAENGLNWRIQILDSGRPGHNWVLLHDDENTAFDAALYAIAKYGGKAVEVDLLRPIRASAFVDPNHNFATANDQRRTCRGAVRPAAPRFTQTILEHLGAPPYLSLHNNYDGHLRSGGSGNMSVRHSGRGLLGLPAHSSADRLADEDNFIIVSGLKPPLRMADRVRQITEELRASGINVIYEHVEEESYDCSLSNYLLLHGGAEPGQYFNIEAEDGDYRSQIAMIDALLGKLIGPLSASR